MGGAGPIEALVESIAGEFAVTAGRPGRVAADCARIRDHLSRPATASELELLRPLLDLVRRGRSPVAGPVFDLLEELAAAGHDPWPLLEGLLGCNDDDLARRALAGVERLVRTRSIAVHPHALQVLARRVDADASPLADPAALATVAAIVRSPGPRAERTAADPVLSLYLDASDGAVRRLAARILDLGGQPAEPDLAARVVGAAGHAFLDRYLRYTRASHLDLLDLVPDGAGEPPCLESLRRAEKVCGEPLLRELVARLGWSHVNLGLEVRRRVGVSVGGSIPLMVSPAEAPLLESRGQTRRSSEVFVVVAHGASAGEAGELADPGPVARFRAYNLAHAAALADILDVAPLTREKVETIVKRMDGIVEGFVALFASSAEESAILPALYQELRRKVVSEMEKEGASPQLSAELTRLVQSFEDPRTVSDVRTLHGLKRYLHQRGLRLGVKLVGAGGATNRTVDLVLASRKRILRTVQRISYVDFEAGHERPVPHAVALVAEGFARQAFHGQEAFPRVQVFCYGNEVQYYLSFRNHPAFLRIDYSPPLAGGMIDLEYFGVSVYEQTVHPCPSLEALTLFLRRLEFDVRIEGTRVHVRYDKERALGLGDLCDKAELLCALIPYLMDLDWTIGSLDLGAEARRAVAEAWAESFAEWGVLPLSRLLTRDRRGVVTVADARPANGRETSWPGEGPWRDLFRVAPPGGFRAGVREALTRLGIDAAGVGEESARVMGQVLLERRVLRPLREAVARGQIVEAAGSLRARPPELFEHTHEAEAFAAILASGEVAGAAQLARLVAPLERMLRFRTSGRLNGYEVQHAPLALRGETLGLYVLRDAGGIVRLALVAQGDVLCRVREPGGPWRPNWTEDAVTVAALLRRDNYLPPGTEVPAWQRREDAAAVRESFRTPNPVPGLRPFPGERVLEGYRASPGRAVGTAVFGARGRTPEDLDGAVLVAASVRPEDTTFLYHAAGIVSTGGGILSHAGLIATQFQKPALIVTGEWRREADGSTTLLYRTPEYREEQREVDGWPVSLHREWREREHRLREGDLVVLDVAEGTLRVLGSEPDVLSLHQAFRVFADAGRRLSRTGDDAEVLVLRGRRLRATHEIRKVLGRVGDLALARHAAHELMGEAFTAPAGADGAELLSLLLANPRVGSAAREHVTALARELARRASSVAAEAARRIPAARTPYEVLALRLEAVHVADALARAAASLRGCGIAPPPAGAPGTDVDGLALGRLRGLRAEAVRALPAPGDSEPIDGAARHRVRRLERLDLVLGEPGDAGLRSARRRLDEADETSMRRLGRRAVLAASEAGFGLQSLIGWKAANLAEVDRLAGGALVPPWFVVTDRAFEDVLDSPLDSAGCTLREAVWALLSRPDLDGAQKSARIRRLWEAVKLPGQLEAEVAAGYAALAAGPGAREGDAAEPFVAIRSSSLEEDAEVAARAGEFETFLFVRGEAAVLEHLKRAWSGLWTERAIHSRDVLGLAAGGTGGGVVIQRMVASRVSGVLQTVNVAEGQPSEMVVNAGLGLGEGIVSGTVAADHVVVMKEGDLERGPLRFRYRTADKREQVVFNARTGTGTARVECLYHQGLRPALEYVELSELVRVAARLEDGYGYPLDLEFGIEGSRLFVLQARPVPTFLSVLRDTLERHPLARAEEAVATPTG